MLGLPKSTEIKKVIPKSALFSKFSMNTLAREKFDADVKRITLVGEVSKNTIAINKGENVSSFFVLLVSLKQEKYDEKNIILLSKLIDQNILLILEYENKAKLAIYHTKLMTSNWKPTEEYSILFRDLTLMPYGKTSLFKSARWKSSKAKHLTSRLKRMSFATSS